MSLPSPNNRFQTTLWSVVLRAGGPDQGAKQAAMEQLCRLYWKPLFIFCLGRKLTRHDAEDLTQAFFARLLTRDILRVADPARGRFRAFLLTSFKHFIADTSDRSRAQRRGGGAVHFPFDGSFPSASVPIPSPDLTPEQAYDRQWAIDLVERATNALKSECDAVGKGVWFERIVGPAAGEAYLEVAKGLGTTEDAVKSFAKRARKRFRDILEREIADTVGSPAELADEVAYLLDLLRR